MSHQDFVELGVHGSASGALVQKPFEVFGGDTLTGNLVHIKITHCGLCYTDIHYLHKDTCLGHEPVGVITQLGPDCNTLQVGDRVQWGFLHDSCRHCEFCWTGQEIQCRRRVLFGGGTPGHNVGGFATGAVMREDYLYKIPDTLSSAHASVLSCAGVTVFAALHNNQVKPSDHVGIVGIGGLGHLGIMMAKAWGCHVTAFSTSADKETDARAFGAHAFVETGGQGRLHVETPLDHLLVTVAGELDYACYMDVLKPRGRMIAMSVDAQDAVAKLPYTPMLVDEKMFVGCVGASRHLHLLTLAFCARHAETIKPVIEEMAMTVENLEKALERLRGGDVRYRIVLSNQVQ